MISACTRRKLPDTCGTVNSRKVYVYVKKKEYSGEPEVFVWPTIVNDEFNVAVSNDNAYSILIHSTIGKLLRKNDNCRYPDNRNIQVISLQGFILSQFTTTP